MAFPIPAFAPVTTHTRPDIVLVVGKGCLPEHNTRTAIRERDEYGKVGTGRTATMYRMYLPTPVGCCCVKRISESIALSCRAVHRIGGAANTHLQRRLAAAMHSKTFSCLHTAVLRHVDVGRMQENARTCTGCSSRATTAKHRLLPPRPPKAMAKRLLPTIPCVDRRASSPRSAAHVGELAGDAEFEGCCCRRFGTRSTS